MLRKRSSVMSEDKKSKLTAVPLEEATPGEIMELVEMMAQQKADQMVRKGGHKCWMFIPSQSEWERMKQFSVDDRCPQCGNGRVIIDIYHGNIGICLNLVCKWSKGGCGFKQYISDPE
jgi:hypothetical protein